MKKVLKWVSFLLAALVLVFFLTGLVVKETTYQVSTTIDKPVEEVFKAFNDHSNLSQWVTSIKSFTPIEEKEGMVGSTYKIIVDDGSGKDFEMTETITEFIENEKVSLAFDAQSMYKTDEISFKAVENGTLITNKATCKGSSYFYKCLFPYFKSMFINTDQTSLDNFKKYIEKTS